MHLVHPKNFYTTIVQFQFLLAITVVAREFEDSGQYADFWRVNKVHYGLGENGECLS